MTRDLRAQLWFRRYRPTYCFRCSRRLTCLCAQGLKSNQFPLYSEAIKFFQHQESMVRIAVRTITLKVYRGECLLATAG